MNSTELALADLRRRIRQIAIPELAESEPADLAMFASAIANFAPNRVTPHWLAVISDSAVADRLTALLKPWTRRAHWAGANGLGPRFFAPIPNGGRRCGLQLVHQRDQRLVIGGSRSIFGHRTGLHIPVIADSLIDLHDSSLYARWPEPCELSPEFRLGLITSSRYAWYAVQSANPQVTARLHAYAIDEFGFDAARATRASAQRLAELSAALIAHLESAIAFAASGIRIGLEQITRLAAAAELTAIATPQYAPVDERRLRVRTRELACSLAALHGRAIVNDADADIAIRYALSQMTPLRQRLLRAVGSGAVPAQFRVSDLADYDVGRAPESTWRRHLNAMSRAGVLMPLKLGFGEFRRYAPTPQVADALGILRLTELPTPQWAAPVVDIVETKIAEYAKGRGLIV